MPSAIASGKIPSAVEIEQILPAMSYENVSLSDSVIALSHPRDVASLNIIEI
jgi:hypothetical protein